MSSSNYVIDVQNFNFKYPGASEPTLKDITLQLPKGSRCLLVGGNGAGKTTMLRILAGKHLHHGHVNILGRDAFHDTTLNSYRSYMGCDWGRRTVAFAGYGCPITADIRVDEMMASVQKEFPERRDMLVKLLGINLSWRMHQLSDGQRRRVQILLQLLRPPVVLFLDEITTDLDVLARQDFLNYLKEDSETNGTTIVYATHIFDGLDDWGTHIAFLSLGKIAEFSTFDSCQTLNQFREKGIRAPLLRTIEFWLREERDSLIKQGLYREEKAARTEDDIFMERNQEAAERANDDVKAAAPNGFTSGRFYSFYGGESM